MRFHTTLGCYHLWVVSIKDRMMVWNGMISSRRPRNLMEFPSCLFFLVTKTVPFLPVNPDIIYVD